MSVDIPTRNTSTRNEAGLSVAPEPVIIDAGPQPDRIPRPSLLATTWAVTWPKLLAVAIALALWQFVYVAGLKPAYLLPGPATALASLGDMAQTSDFWQGLQTTVMRGVFGFVVAVLIGSLLGIAVSQWRVLRLGVGSMVTGLQTMPSIAWFPLAILLFGLSEQAILFVIILGAAPSVANGIIGGIDEVPPALSRAGYMLGARGIDRYRHIVLPAAFPAYLSGLKQGWAFAWRSLLAGELLVTVGNKGVGALMSDARSFGQPDNLLALMIVVLILGMLIDVLFNAVTNRVRTRRGLTGF
jgi:NitT/TauT family transport system permease protein